MLIVSTLAITVCFMVWMMFDVIGIPLKQPLGLSATEFGLPTATPVLTGSLIRLPLDIWTDCCGGRIVITLLMAVTVPGHPPSRRFTRHLRCIKKRPFGMRCRFSAALPRR